MSELRQLIGELASGIKGIIGVVISDKDGVPVLKVPLDTNSPILDSCFRHQFLSVCGTLSEHGFKMCLGPTNRILSNFDDYQVVHCYQSSLILTIIASNEALTGQIMNLSTNLKPLMGDIAKQIMPPPVVQLS